MEITKNSLADLCVRKFLEETASTAPTPGGGSVSALTAALATALGDMTGELTVGKPKFADVEDELRTCIEKAHELIDRFCELADADEEAFLPLSEVYSMPKDTEGYKELKERCLKNAAEVPMRILRSCLEALDLIDVFARKGSRIVISDAASAASICRGAALAALINIKVNTRLMSDRAYAWNMDREADETAKHCCLMADGIYSHVTAELDRSTVPLVMKGAPVAQAITAELALRVRSLELRGVTPTLAILRIGEDPSDVAYERSVVKRSEAVGVRVEVSLLPSDAPDEEVFATIRRINADPDLHGCLILRPFKNRAAEEKAAMYLTPAKDLDCMTAVSQGALFMGTEGFAPCTAESVTEILKYYGISPAGKHVVILGRSLVIGKPLTLLLTNADATVTICHSKSANLKEICRRADILVSAIGKTDIINEDYLSPGQIVIDVGINSDSEGRLQGDIGEKAKEKYSAAYTPVPGGVGSVTSAVLFRHLIDAAEGHYGS